MNKSCFIVILLLCCRVTFAQNLVPNASFEQYSGCPDGYAQLDSTLFWMNPGYSADYYNQCTSNPSIDVPNNYLGYQQAHSGVAYAGIFLYILFGNNAREYIEAPLTSTLIANACYHFEMYVNLGDICSITTHNIGVYFSDTAITVSNNQPLPFNPQINNIGPAFDTLNWTLVSGDYLAQGGENYLIIGNFNNDVNTDTTILDSTLLYYGVYCYIDDVSLSLCTGINELNENGLVKITPNPAKDKATLLYKLSSASQHASIIIRDVTGKLITSSALAFDKESIAISTDGWASGIYIVLLKTDNFIKESYKLVISK